MKCWLRPKKFDENLCKAVPTLNLGLRKYKSLEDIFLNATTKEEERT